MCKCDPNKRTPWCGAEGCEAPEQKEQPHPVTAGTIWRHYNGSVYTVIDILNPDNPQDDDKPPTVSYIGTNGKRWARRLDDWHRSFTLLIGAGVVMLTLQPANKESAEKMAEEIKVTRI